MLRFAESHSSGCLHRLCVGCVFPWGWRDRLSTPQVQRLPLRRPRLPRRKRDCTPPSSSHVRGVLQRRRCVLRWRKDCSSGLPPHIAGLYLGGRGTGLLPHNFGDFLGGGRTGLPPHNVGMYFGGRGTSPLPHKVCVYLGGGGTGPPPHNDGVYFGGRETGSRPHTDECFMCHNGQDPLLFLADMFLMLYQGWLDTVWMLLKQNSDKRGVLSVVFSSCLGNVRRSMLFSCLSP